MSDDWYRAKTWDKDVQREFEARLARARSSNRPQYLRIQAVSLVDAGAPTRDAIALFQRVIDEYPDSRDAVSARESLADIARSEGRLKDAEAHLRRCIEEAAPSMSMTSGVPDLTLAEILIEQGGREELREARELLGEEGLQQRLSMRHHVFRYLVALACFADAVGDGSATELAKRALEVAAETKPQFPRHPGVGDVLADEDTLKELWRLARSEPGPN